MKKNTILAGVAATAALFCTATLPAQQPRVFLLDAALLARVKDAPANDAGKLRLIAAATRDADRAMHDSPFTVMSKGITPPSGDKHDYMSQAPYFWPDPSKPDGKPYIRRDGERNPEIRKITDHDSLGKLGEDVRALGLAYYLTGKKEYADRAALLIRTWFLGPATRMNPNLEFGQGIPGINTGRGIGLIETRSFTSVVDAVGLIQPSGAWTDADQQALQAWFARFVEWMRTSSKGKDEAAAKNNHGTWYDLQLTDYALFLGDRKLASETVRQAETKRIARQVEPDGKQPLELARTKAFGYSEGNLDGLMQLAGLGKEVGVDLWNFRTADGRSIRTALNYLLPFSTREKPWPYQQIDGFHGDMLLNVVRMGALAYGDVSYKAAADKLGSSRNDVGTAIYQLELTR